MLNKQAIRWISIGLAAALAILAIVAAASSVYARSKPPPALLRYDNETIQRGNLGTYCWTHGRIGECADAAGYDFPRGVLVPDDARLFVRFDKDEKPSQASVQAWSRVDEDGQPVGNGRGLRNFFEKVREGGEVVAWKVGFNVRRAGRHYYLSVSVDWADKGDAFYDLHVKTGGELTCAGRPVTITDGAGAGEVIGTSGNDVIVTRGGRDVVKAMGGDDRVCSGAAADRVHGGKGQDVLVTKDGSDDVFGGRGKDHLRAGGGLDVISGGPARDVCSGGPTYYPSCELRTIRID